MSRVVLSLFAALALATVALVAPAAAQGRFAVVVGVEDYPDVVGAAPGARADARYVADALEAEGFAVELIENADEASLKRSVYDLADRLQNAGPSAIGVFYFAGHGVQMNNDSFLLPINVRASDDLTLSASALSGEVVSERLAAVASARSLIVVDAAAPNPLTARFGLAPGLAAVDPPPGGLIIYSHYPDQIALPRQEGVSVFAQAFADLVRDDQPSLEAALQRLRRTVSEESGGTRYAWISGDTAAPLTLSARRAAEPAAGPRGAAAGSRSLPTPAPATPAPSAPAERSLAPPPPPPPSTAPAGETAAATAEPQQIHLVEVFFGTDRAVRQRNGAPEFTHDSAGALTYGVAEVSIPPRHEIGELESPRWWRFEFTPDPEKHVVFRGASLRDEDAFFDEVRGVVQESAQKQAFVFIHGFNTTFADAARRTAQMHHDLAFDGAPIFYSWPSEASSSPLAYAHDLNAADRAAPLLQQFLMMVADRTGAEKIHVIAHSMGNRTLVAALDEIAEDLAREGRAAPFSQIILSAPDIDRSVFLGIADEIVPTAARLTLYASANDAAMRLSKGFNGDPRAGDSSDGIVIVNGLNTIDATEVHTELFGIGHDYFAGDVSILHDIGALIATNADPEERGLEERFRPPNADEYWAILKGMFDRD